MHDTFYYINMTEEKHFPSEHDELPTTLTQERPAEDNLEAIHNHPEKAEERDAETAGKKKDESQGSIRDFAVHLLPQREVTTKLIAV